MIKLLREGTEVKVQVEANVGLAARYFISRINCSDEVYACLLLENFQTKLRSVLSEIRRTSYEQGWKDAKAKVGKSDWFSGGW